MPATIVAKATSSRPVADLTGGRFRYDDAIEPCLLLLSKIELSALELKPGVERRSRTQEGETAEIEAQISVPVARADLDSTGCTPTLRP